MSLNSKKIFAAPQISRMKNKDILPDQKIISRDHFPMDKVHFFSSDKEDLHGLYPHDADYAIYDDQNRLVFLVGAYEVSVGNLEYLSECKETYALFGTRFEIIQSDEDLQSVLASLCSPKHKAA